MNLQVRIKGSRLEMQATTDRCTACDLRRAARRTLQAQRTAPSACGKPTSTRAAATLSQVGVRSESVGKLWSLVDSFGSGRIDEVLLASCCDRARTAAPPSSGKPTSTHAAASPPQVGRSHLAPPLPAGVRAAGAGFRRARSHCAAARDCVFMAVCVFQGAAPHAERRHAEYSQVEFAHK